MQGVYRIRNKINDKRYIGSAQDFDERWDTHRKELRKGNHYNKYLQRAWNRHGEENFVFEVEEEVVGDNKNLLTVEQAYLDKGFELGILYNISKVAGGGAVRGSGWHQTKKTKEEISKALLGRNVTWGDKISEGRKGMKFSNEHRANQRKSWTSARRSEQSKRLKKWWTPDRREKRSLRYSGGGNPNVRSYPAFFNVKTNEFILAGSNLKGLCNEQNLVYENMRMVARGQTEQTKDGWKLG